MDFDEQYSRKGVNNWTRFRRGVGIVALICYILVHAGYKL